tara:strand:+ start:245 stop:520 length:276 start_codon:yes stop_codon:yes gene_type:complete
MDNNNILLKANDIVFKRKEEKKRMYGPFSESMDHAACIASTILKKNITTQDMYICMTALKLSRQMHKHKEDNLLDAIAYLAGLNDYNENNI